MEKTKKYAWVMDALSKTPLSVKLRAMKKFLAGEKEYLPEKKTNADMDAIIKCSLCPNMCKFDCPVLEAGKNEALSPSAKMRIAYFIEKGLIGSEDSFELMYKCCSCDACRQWCPFDFSVGDILKGVRADIVEENKTPEKILEIKEKLEKNHIMDEKSFEARGEEKGETLYFMGCVVQSKRKEIGEAMIKIFDMAGEEYAVMEGEWCCGAPLHNLGFINEFKEFAKHNVEKIKESECKVMICSCPTCTYVFKQIYPQFGFKIKAKIMHSSEYLFDIIQNRKIEVGSVEKECVYHDPCTLARKLGIEKEPREVLRNTGIVLKEAYFNKKDTKCCGHGGQLSRTNPDIAEKIAENRIKELAEVAKCIVTACPSCKTAFENCKEVYDLSEVVLMGMIE